jgi:hypothetical protein
VRTVWAVVDRWCLLKILSGQVGVVMSNHKGVVWMARFASAFRTTAHVPIFVGRSYNAVSCTACGRRSPCRIAARWLNGTCRGRLAGVQGSHTLGCYRGLSFCTCCGLYSATLVSRLGLGSECTSIPTGHRAYNLRRLARGRLPYGVSAWPLRA